MQNMWVQRVAKDPPPAIAHSSVKTLLFGDVRGKVW